MSRTGWEGQDGGFVVWWLIGTSTVALLMFALVADGSRVMAAVNDTADVAQVAARSAARMVDPSTGRLDPTRAEANAQAELSAAGMTGTVIVASTTVTVVAIQTVTLPRLATVGIDQKSVSSTRSATIIDPPLP